MYLLQFKSSSSSLLSLIEPTTFPSRPASWRMSALRPFKARDLFKFNNVCVQILCNIPAIYLCILSRDVGTATSGQKRYDCCSTPERGSMNSSSSGLSHLYIVQSQLLFHLSIKMAGSLLNPGVAEWSDNGLWCVFLLSTRSGDILLKLTDTTPVIRYSISSIQQFWERLKDRATNGTGTSRLSPSHRNTDVSASLEK